MGDADQEAGESADGRVLAEELAEFASRASHDLLGPLNQAASLLALFVRRYRGQLDSEADVLMEHLSNAAVKMDTVAAGIRRYLNMAGRPLEVRRVDLNAALAAALAVLDPAVKSSGAAITADPLPPVDGDNDRIAALFEILIGNAVRFRRPAETPRIHVSASRRGSDILIAVADNGIGIDPKHCQEVLLPFRRLNGREYPGAGLGLATASLIVRLHGGGLRIDSALEAGATVTVTFPGRTVAA